MTFVWPMGLSCLCLTLLLLYLHRRMPGRAVKAFSAFYLLPRSVRSGDKGPTFKSPVLFVLRLLVLVLVSLALSGPSVGIGTGTMVLAAGPFEPASDWPQPVTIIRAGWPPSHVDDPARIAPVATRPNWDGALLLGQKHAPNAQIKVIPVEPFSAFTGGGAELDGAAVVVTATTRSSTAPIIKLNDLTDVAMEQRSDDWYFRGALTAGPASMHIPGSADWPICVPETGPLLVASGGWPKVVADVFKVLPSVETTSTKEASWRPGPAPSQPLRGWAAFSDPITSFSFRSGALPRPVAAHFATRLPPTGATLEHWQKVPDGGEPILFAGQDAVLARYSSVEGQHVAFGFDVEDTDLVHSPSWPVLFFDLVQQARTARMRCRTNIAGEALMLIATTEIKVISPSGVERVFQPRGGLALISGLDELGHYRLESAGRQAFVANQPNVLNRDPVTKPLHSVDQAGLRLDKHFAWFGAVVLCLILILTQRLMALEMALFALVIGFTLAEWGLFQGKEGGVVLAVDVSASVPRPELEQAVRSIEVQLGERITHRVEGDARVRRIGPRGTELLKSDGVVQETRWAPMLDAAQSLAGDAGVVLLVSDGEVRALEYSPETPVFTVKVRSPRPDVALHEASAVRLGETVFVRILASADRDISTTMRIGTAPPRRVQIKRGRHWLTAQAQVASNRLTVALSVPGDRQIANDQLTVSIDEPSRNGAAILGEKPIAWAQAAGLDPLALTAALLEEEATSLAKVRALFLHDVPASRLRPNSIAQLRSWIESGGLLFLSGFDRAFGLGGWSGSVLDALSPLKSDPRNDDERLAAMLLIDRSGSLSEVAGGVGLARVAELSAVVAAALDPRDLLGAMAFGGEVDTLTELRPVSAFRKTKFPIPTLARGGTLLSPALTQAAGRLDSHSVKKKLVFVVSDGRYADEDEAAEAVGQLRSKGIEVVGIIVGAEPPSDNAVAIFREGQDGLIWAHGSAWADNLARLVVSTASDGLSRGAGQVTAETTWASRVGGALPPKQRSLRAYAPPQARVIARSAGEPFLAEWSIGRGRVIALATDEWGLTPAQWSNLLAPALAPLPSEPDVFIEDDILHVKSHVDTSMPTRAIVTDGIELTTHSLHLVGPGHSRARLPSGLSGPINVRFAMADGSFEKRIDRPHPREILGWDNETHQLELLSALSGGQSLYGDALLPSIEPVLEARRGVETDGILPWSILMLLVFEVLRWSGQVGFLSRQIWYSRDTRLSSRLLAGQSENLK